VFSDLIVQDALWEDDEVEWVAGILVLQALIRTSMRGDPGQRKLYEDLLVNYEERWKEMKDEARQALVTVCPAISRHYLHAERVLGCPYCSQDGSRESGCVSLRSPYNNM
jgi:hypothetical protein